MLRRSTNLIRRWNRFRSFPAAAIWRRWPMAFKADGMTKLNDAIVDAAKALATREEKRKAIIILSDGIDTFSKASSGQSR